jgi:ABC-type polysaccharide/polyol phosphate export permease
MLPALLAVSLMMAIGLGFIISALNTFYEDVKYVAGIAMYLLFFLSPVMYFTEQVAATGANIESGNWLFRIYHLNPLAVLCTAYRKALLAPVAVPIRGAEVSPPVDLNPFYYVWLVVFSFSIMVFGYWFFNRVKWKFVERP